jgi:hypothetical protein
MKRWWNSPQQRPVVRTRRRVGRVLAPAMMAGAVCLALPTRTLGQCADLRAATSDAQLVVRDACPIFVHLPRTGGAVIEAWAIGILSNATQPDSREACDLDHVCALAISTAGGAGTGMGTTIKTSFETTSQGEPPPNLPFTLTETIDYAHPATKGVKGGNGPGACYPASGVMSIAVDAYSTLVLDIVGQACQVGSNTTQVVFTGSYVADEASTGTVANADGIGSVNINNPSGLSGAGTNTPAAKAPWMKASLVGQLIYGN